VNKNTLKFMRLCETHNLDVIECYSDKSGERVRFWIIHKDYKFIACISVIDFESLSREELDNIMLSASMDSLW
jgi:hypothetical protein